MEVEVEEEEEVEEVEEVEEEEVVVAEVARSQGRASSAASDPTRRHRIEPCNRPVRRSRMRSNSDRFRT